MQSQLKLLLLCACGLSASISLAEPAACEALYKAGRYFVQQLERKEITPEQWAQLIGPMNEQLDLAGCIDNDNRITLEVFLTEKEALAGEVSADKDGLCQGLRGLSDYYRDLHFGRKSVGRAYFDRADSALSRVFAIQACPALVPAPKAVQPPVIAGGGGDNNVIAPQQVVARRPVRPHAPVAATTTPGFFQGIKEAVSKGIAKGLETRFKPAAQAIKIQDITALRALLDDGFDVNWSGGAGETLLMVAASEKFGWGRGGRMPEIFQFLLERGAKLEAKNDHEDTALLLAALHKNPEAAKLLLLQGANINVRNKSGSTPLTAALVCGVPRRRPMIRLDLVRILLEHGADANTANGRGEIPLRLAISCQAEMYEVPGLNDLLREYGAHE